jgi:hypothetical protein
LISDQNVLIVGQQTSTSLIIEAEIFDQVPVDWGIGCGENINQGV